METAFKKRKAYIIHSSITNMNHSLLIPLVVALGINLVMFIPAFIYKTDKLTDISYAVTFAVVALFGFFFTAYSPATLLLLVMILAWSFRLGSYLFIRINKTGKDTRFDGMRESFWKFLRFWLLQGLTVFVVMIPSSYFFSWPMHNLTVISWIGFVVFILGLAIETIADAQKYRFMNDVSKTGTWIETGIWKYSRHPNYLGEMMVWMGVYLFVVPSLFLVPALVSLVSPLYIICLILFVSGIPLLEKSADARWGNNPAYKEYKRRTSILLLWFKKK
jgi:steroid 5-alpha reductase family enzyme